MAERGLFIVIEGCDKAGKTTQMEMLEDYVKSQGREFVRTREPGGTEDGEKIRKFLLERDAILNPLSPNEEALGFYLSRGIHLRKKVGPALEEGKDVGTDRLDASTFVYQGVVQKVDFNFLRSLRKYVVTDSGYKPDITIFLDITIEEYEKRLKLEKDPSKFLVYEQKGPDFMRKVLRGYRRYYCGLDEEHVSNENLMPLNGMRSKELIHEDIKLVVDETRKHGRVTRSTKLRLLEELRQEFDSLINDRYADDYEGLNT